MNAHQLGEVAARRRQRRQRRRVEGEPFYVVLTFMMLEADRDRVIPTVVLAVGGRFSGADVYRAAADVNPYAFLGHGGGDTLSAYHNNTFVLPGDTFRTDRDREFYVIPTMGVPPHWHVRRGWVPV